MTYCDHLFPGNPRRRQQVEHLHQKLRESVLPNAHTILKQMGTMRAYMQSQLNFVEGTGESQLSQACATLLSNMGNMQKDMSTVDMLLKQRLTSTSYAILQGIPEPRTEDAVKLRSTIVNSFWILAVVLMAINLIVFCVHITIVIGNTPLAIFIQMNASLVLILATLCLCFGMDVLLSTALGAWEKDQLKKKIKYYENTLIEHAASAEE
ncbi:single-pass membrane and coiled-coil domain-containing protein 3-like [Ambystoma mexicanum]|uniref:single-pass membrane and coiled-coil domain-containing protein 3-like n=1 Tax=Ambystoma mexicanum TaxID=8296 RepID=UPI0037E77AF8